MTATQSLKAADKQKILKKLTTEMKKHVKASPPKQSLSVLETLLYAICLENSTYQAAEDAYAKVLDTFFDLNEIRVSSVTEIEKALGDITDPDWKALRIRETLQHIFEKFYAFDLEILKRKTQDAAIKELEQIPYITPFVRDYILQQALGAHVVPIDRLMCQLLKWLGLTETETDEQQAGDAIKAGTKKADAPQLCFLLKLISADPILQPGLEQYADLPEDTDPFAAASRLGELYKKPVKRELVKKAKTVSRKKPETKAPQRPTSKSSPKKSAPKSVKKAVKKTTKKKPTSRKK